MNIKTTDMIKRWSLLIMLCLIAGTASRGQGLFESAQVEFNGFVRGSAFGGSELYDYSSLFGEFCLQSKLSHGSTYLYADLRFRGGVNFDEEYVEIQLREVYAGYQSDKFDLFLGNQIVTWGRTDGFNPTNNITPNDYFFLTSDMDDQKLSSFMLRMKYRLSPVIDIELIGIPVYSPSNYRFDLFDLGEGVSYGEATLPGKSFGNGSVATRLNFEFSKIGFSVSCFRGYDPFYGFNVKSVDFITGEPVIINTATPYLKNTIGADFSMPVSSWILRGEAAYNITDDYEQFMYIPNPDITYVAGVEHDFWGVTTILQYVGKKTLDFTKLQLPVLSDPSDPLAQIQYAVEMIEYESALFNRKMFYQQEETNHAIVLLLSKAFAYDTWNVELAGYYNITSEDLMIRPKVTWRITDALTASLGGSYMSGPEKSIFDYSAPVLSGVFAELKASF
ncbi:MAG: hypothetical protein K8R35_00425 [Bacteroidales bacterium]|nr:hypothetical protein [Bacteroidales bacterium]